jgi:hypothetical protein
MDALELLERYLEVRGQRFYPPDEPVPVDGVVPADWREAVVDEQGKVERIPYELCVLRAVRDAIRRREIYIEAARRWRDPDEDLPADFEHNREVHYAAIRKPLSATARGLEPISFDRRSQSPLRSWPRSSPSRSPDRTA